MRLSAGGAIHNANLGIDVRLPTDKLIYNQLKMNCDYKWYLSIAIRVCRGVSPLHEQQHVIGLLVAKVILKMQEPRFLCSAVYLVLGA